MTFVSNSTGPYDITGDSVEDLIRIKAEYYKEKMQMPEQTPRANERQVGGDHYKKMPIEHWDLVAIFDWDFFQAQITRYMMRWRDKDGLKDLEKMTHVAQKYLEVERLRAEGKLTPTILREAIQKLGGESTSRPKLHSREDYVEQIFDMLGILDTDQLQRVRDHLAPAYSGPRPGYGADAPDPLAGMPGRAPQPEGPASPAPSHHGGAPHHGAAPAAPSAGTRGDVGVHPSGQPSPSPLHPNGGPWPQGT
jgi:hypothetical protein